MLKMINMLLGRIKPVIHRLLAAALHSLAVRWLWVTPGLHDQDISSCVALYFLFYYTPRK
jgi:hypothetical protein